jgi:hypothetical protein
MVFRSRSETVTSDAKALYFSNRMSGLMANAQFDESNVKIRYDPGGTEGNMNLRDVSSGSPPGIDSISGIGPSSGRRKTAVGARLLAGI